MEHASFDANVGRALRAAGRRVIDRDGFVWTPIECCRVPDSLAVPLDKDGPYTLADPAPLTDEQAKAAARAGAVVKAPDSLRLRIVNGDWQYRCGDAWKTTASRNVPGSCCRDMRDGWFITPDPSRAAEDESEAVTFGLRAAQGAWSGSTDALEWRGTPSAAWKRLVGYPTQPCDAFRFTPHYQPTAAQVSAVVKAEPERLCAGCVLEHGGKPGDTFAWIGGQWCLWFLGEWHPEAGGCPEDYPREWDLCIRPDYKPTEDEPEAVTLDAEPQDVRVTLDCDETSVRLYVNGRLFVPYGDGPDAPIPRGVVKHEQPFADSTVDAIRAVQDAVMREQPEPQDTLAACMRWCDDRDHGAWLARQAWLDNESRCDWKIGADAEGDLMDIGRLAWLTVHDIHEATDWLLSTDEGATWFSPTQGPPEVKPKSGAELRRWLVRNPGRVVLCRPGEHKVHWDAERCAFFDCEGDLAVVYDINECIPADGGTWESEGP